MGAPADQSQGCTCVSAAGVKCMCTRRVKSGRCIKSMNAKNTEKSTIHENADANITCDFGEGDINRSRSRLPHGQPYTYIVSSIILRYVVFVMYSVSVM